MKIKRLSKLDYGRAGSTLAAHMMVLCVEQATRLERMKQGIRKLIYPNPNKQ